GRAFRAAPAEDALEHHAARRAADLDDGGGELVALLHRQRAVAVAQLRQLDHAVGLGAEVDERGVAADRDDPPAHLVTDGGLLALLLAAAGLGSFVLREQPGELVFVARIFRGHGERSLQRMRPRAISSACPPRPPARSPVPTSSPRPSRSSSTSATARPSSPSRASSRPAPSAGTSTRKRASPSTARRCPSRWARTSSS